MSWLQSIIQVYGFQLGAVILIVGLITQFWPLIVKGLGNIPAINVGGNISENQKDFAALERLQARFEKAGCDEGKAAIQVCLQHFFHGQGTHT